jgi:hypothetical protein
VEATSDTLRQLADQLARLPSVAAEVARKASSPLTALLKRAHASGVTVYGDARPSGHHGPVDLDETGAVKSRLAFKVVGTQLFVVLPMPYARFLIRFGLLPRGGDPRPAEWDRIIDEIATKAIRERIEP